MTLRIRCQVLRAVAIRDGATSQGIADMLPELSAQQVQKAIYQLLSQDRIFKTGKQEREGSNGRPLFVYEANEDWEPAAVKAKTKKKSGRKTHSDELRTNSAGGLGVIRFRDRKVRLLIKLLSKVSGTDKDLLIGLLADLGHKHDGKI